ncbi:heat stress transcription factor B-4-like protein [Tanacetum coccineum]
MYVSGHVDIFDMVDIDLLTVVALNMMVLKLGYIGKSEPMFYNYLRPFTSLNEGLYALSCEEDVRCLATLVRSFKLIEVYIEHGVTTLDSYLRHHVEIQSELLVSEEPDIGRTQKPILVEVSTQEPIMAEEFSVEDVVLEDYVSSGEDVEHYNGEFDESAPSDGQFFFDDEGIDTTYETEYDVQSSEDTGTDDDDDVDGDFLVDKENEIVEPDVDVHLFGISMDLPFDNIGVTNILLEDVLEGEDVDVINADGFDSDPGNDEETNYKKRRLAKLRTEMEGVMNASGQWKYSFYTSQKFTTPKVAKDRAYLHSIENGRNLKLYKNDGVRIRARCDGKVPVFTMSQGTGPTGPNHGMEAGPSGSSGPTTRSKKGRIQIFEQVRVNPDIPVKAVQDQLQRELEVQISMSKAFRAKAKAEREIRGDHLKGNDPSCLPRVFRDLRLFWCLGALKLGFRACRRDLLGLDGAFMKGPFPGQVLVAVGLDSNNGIYPLAYALVEAESKSSWCWFLQCLGDDIDLHPNSNFTFISDRQKGWCGQAYKDLMWRAASTTNVKDLEMCRAKYDLLLNNICEVFNGKIIGGRDKPVITLLEIMESIKKEARLMKVQWNGNNKYQVSGSLGDQCIVDVVGRPRKKRKRSKHEDEPCVKDGKLSRKGRTITCQSYRNTGHNKATYKGQGGNNAEACGSASRQAQQIEPIIGQDGLGGLGVGVVIGLSTTAGEGGAGGPGGAGGASQGLSHMSEIRNADGREIGDGVPTQSSAAGGASEWSFL